jgi:hypothetical protein
VSAPRPGNGYTTSTWDIRPACDILVTCGLGLALSKKPTRATSPLLARVSKGSLKAAATWLRLPDKTPSWNLTTVVTGPFSRAKLNVTRVTAAKTMAEATEPGWARAMPQCYRFVNPGPFMAS